MSDTQTQVPGSRAVEGSKGRTAKTIVVLLAYCGIFMRLYSIAPERLRVAVLAGIGVLILALGIFVVVFVVRWTRQSRRFKPAYTGEYDFLGVAWVEMRSFLMTHMLACWEPDSVGHAAASAALRGARPDPVRERAREPDE